MKILSKCGQLVRESRSPVPTAAEPPVPAAAKLPIPVATTVASRTSLDGGPEFKGKSLLLDYHLHVAVLSCLTSRQFLTKKEFNYYNDSTSVPNLSAMDTVNVGTTISCEESSLKMLQYESLFQRLFSYMDFPTHACGWEMRQCVRPDFLRFSLERFHGIMIMYIRTGREVIKLITLINQLIN